MQVVAERSVGSGAAGGFSLTELVVSLAVLGVLLAIAGPRFGEYLRANGFEASVEAVTEDLNYVRERASAEATADRVYGIAFTLGADTYTLFKGDPATQVGSGRLDWGAYVASVECVAPDTTIGPACYFYGRGTASKGTITIAQHGSGRSTTIEIGPLTGSVTHV